MRLLRSNKLLIFRPRMISKIKVLILLGKVIDSLTMTLMLKLIASTLTRVRESKPGQLSFCCDETDGEDSG